MRAGRWGLVFTMVLVGCLCGPAGAIATDANSVPPRVKLWAGGQPEGEFGPRDSEFGEYYEDLAFFETEEPGPSWAYRVGSTVSFSCLVDGQPVACPAEHEPCCRATRGVAFKGAAPFDGPFRGKVPMPPGLTPGTHTLTVVASDEDGVAPVPPSITIFLDTTPPAAPNLLDVPAKVSHDGKPDFHFESADDHAFPGEDDHPGIFYQPFEASLRRIRPPGPTLHSANPFDSYVSVWRQRCMTTYECSAFARPEYEAGNGSLSFGIPELLRPGLYEFGVQARDAVGNKSATTKYRFRIRRPKSG